MAIRLKGCERCGGDLLEGLRALGEDWVCLQCGNVVEMETPPVTPKKTVRGQAKLVGSVRYE